MKPVFADTVYWVASITPNDPWHYPALRVAAALGDSPLVTTEEVLVEFLSAYAARGAFLRRIALHTVHAILENSRVAVQPQSHHSFLQGIELYGHRADKAYSLVDCISMQTMRELGLTDVLTSAYHFVQEGFTRLMNCHER